MAQTTPAPKRAGFLLALLLLTAAASPLAAAQTRFGSQVKVGDADHAPLARKDALAVTVSEHVADSQMVLDGCLFLDAYTAAGVQFGDIHLNPCNGKAPGALVDDDEAVRRAAAKAVTVSFVYADLDGSGSYGKGDSVYMTTTAGTLAFSNAPGTWSLRLTPTAAGPAGSFVRLGDSDATAWRSQVKTLSMSLVQGDDKAYALIPLPAPRCGTLDAGAGGWATAPAANLKVCDEGNSILKNQVLPLPAGSIRLSNLAAPQPKVVPTQVSAVEGQWQAGDEVSVAVQVHNRGNAPGAGLLVARLGNRIVDARLSPILSPGEKTTVTHTFQVPAEFHGQLVFAIQNLTQTVQVNGLEAAATASETPQLQQALAQLQARIDALEARNPATGTAGEPQVGPQAAQAARATPSPMAPTLLLGLLAVGLAVPRLRK